MLSFVFLLLLTSLFSTFPFGKTEAFILKFSELSLNKINVKWISFCKLRRKSPQSPWKAREETYFFHLKKKICFTHSECHLNNTASSSFVQPQFYILSSTIFFISFFGSGTIIPLPLTFAEFRPPSGAVHRSDTISNHATLFVSTGTCLKKVWQLLRRKENKWSHAPKGSKFACIFSEFLGRWKPVVSGEFFCSLSWISRENTLII